MILGWCSTGHHKDCKKSVKQFMVDPRQGIVYTDVVYKCECPKRGCKCYVKRADRTKTKTRARKK